MKLNKLLLLGLLVLCGLAVFQAKAQNSKKYQAKIVSANGFSNLYEESTTSTTTTTTTTDTDTSSDDDEDAEDDNSGAADESDEE